MPAPAAAFYDITRKGLLSTYFMSIFDTVTGQAYMKIYDEDDLLLSQIFLTEPPGTIDANGVITLTNTPDPSANASGIATWMELYNPDDLLFLTVPVKAGVSPESGYLVMTSTTFILGQPVTVTGFTIG